MKKVYLALALSNLLLCATGIHAQALVPFPTPGFVETEVYHTDWTTQFIVVNRSFGYTHDTIVGSNTFAQYRYLPNQYAQNAFYTWYNNGKVYWTLNNTPANPAASGILLYDFTLQVGDTFQLTNGAIALFGTFTVDSVGSVMINSQPRKWMRLVNGTDTLRWIDAIGDVEHGFFYESDFEGGYEEYVCASDSTGYLYGAPTSPFNCNASGPVSGNGPNSCDNFNFNAAIGGVTCSGCDGSVYISGVTGGTPGYTYSWSNGGNGTYVYNLCQGPITLTITDATGLSCSRTFNIPASNLSASIQITNNNPCDGADTICAIPSGGSAPYTWQWSTGSTTMCVPVTASGTYSVLVWSSDGCSMTTTVSVTVPAPLQVSEQVTAPSCQLCCDGNVVLNPNGGVGTYAYSWSPMYPGVGAFCPGTYTWCVTDANGCMTCDTVAVMGPLGIDTHERDEITLQPNPASDELIIHRASVQSEILQVKDLNGKVILDATLVQQVETLNVTSLAEGVYFVEVGGTITKLVITR